MIQEVSGVTDTPEWGLVALAIQDELQEFHCQGPAPS